MLCRIPDIVLQIRELVESTTQGLERLGKPPSNDSIGEISSLVDQLARDIESGIQHVSREPGNVLCIIEDEATKFKSELRATCPEFRAWNNDIKEPPSITPLPELLLEEGEKSTGIQRNIIYLNEVLDKKTR
jgi:hypothetical protein